MTLSASFVATAVLTTYNDSTPACGESIIVLDKGEVLVSLSALEETAKGDRSRSGMLSLQKGFTKGEKKGGQALVIGNRDATYT